MEKNNQTLLAGKLNTEFLGRLLAEYNVDSERLVVPPRVGEDAAVINLPDRYLVIATDPITFVTEDVGYYVVTINANDVATMGAQPKFFSCVLLFPAREDPAQVERVFQDIQKACLSHQVTWIGGHTEITPTVNSPVAIGQMIGEVDKLDLIHKSAMRPGDRLLLTKALAVEAVSIIARSRSEEVRAQFGRSYLERARGFIKSPGISIVEEALAACQAGGVQTMHDLTEGGLLGGILELAEVSGYGLVVDRGSLPFYLETKQLCQLFDMNPLKVIASGSLVIVAEPAFCGSILQTLADLEIECCDIGEVIEEPVCRFTNGEEITAFTADEITKLF